MRMTPLLAQVACLAGFVYLAPAVAADDPNTATAARSGVRTWPAPGNNTTASSIVGPWLPLAPMPESKEQFGLEACGGKIYAVAGICNGEETGSSFVYDTTTGVWSPIAPLPRAVQSICLRAVNGHLFCFQGYHHTTQLKYPDVFLYDPNADRWLTRHPIAIPREDSGSAVINGRVWIVGGFTHPGHTIVPQIDIYDPALDLWLPPFPIKPHDAPWPGRALGDFGCAIGDHFWCMGGTEITENYPFLRPSPWGFFTDGTDLGLIPIPDPRCYAEVEVIGASLFVVGGCRTSTTDYADTMLTLDLPTQTWKKPVLLPYPARGQGACTWNGVLYVAGGYDGRTRTDFCLWLGEDAK